MDNELEGRSSLENIIEYGQLFLHWSWLLILAAMIAGGVAYYLTNRQQRVYESTTLVMVNGATGASYDSTLAIYSGKQLATTYARTMATQPVLDEVAKILGFPVKSSAIKVQQVEETQLINITVNDANPQRAADIANTLVAVFAEQVTNDQTSRYIDLKSSLEIELAALDEQISAINEKLAALEVQTSNALATPNPEIYVKRSELETILSQYQQSRSYLFSNYQQIKLTEAQSISTIIQKDPAVPGLKPIAPQPMKSAGLAAVVSLMVVAGIIFLVEFLKDEIRDPEEITRRWGIPVLGVVANYHSNQSGLITLSHPRSPVSETFRSLRTALQFSAIDQPLHTLLVTSASPSDGKTSIASNLAVVMAQNQRSVITIDADFRRPQLHKMFSLTNRIGLTDYFIRVNDVIESVINKTSIKGLNVVTSGSIPPNPSELLNSAKMLEVIKQLGGKFSTVILDSPPILAVTDALILAPHADGVLLVVNPKKTKRGAFKHAIEQLNRVNANILGVVINNVRLNRAHYYYDRDVYYTSRYGKPADDKRKD